MFKTTNFIFSRFSHIYQPCKVINVIIIMLKLYFNSYTGKTELLKNGIQYFRNGKFGSLYYHLRCVWCILQIKSIQVNSFILTPCMIWLQYIVVWNNKYKQEGSQKNKVYLTGRLKSSNRFGINQIYFYFRPVMHKNVPYNCRLTFLNK